MNKKVSVIVPVYNSERTLPNCIYSILNQTYKNIEIIIVDDGSNDNSEKICNKFKKIYSNIIYVRQKNNGVSSARNTGIKKSSGKWIMFVDSDDTIDSNLIEELIKKNNNNNLVGAKLKKIFPRRITTSNYISKYSIKEFIINIADGKIFGGVLGYLFDKNYIPFFDQNTSYMEDTIFMLNYLKKVKKIEYVDSYYNYIFSENSITNTFNTKKIERNIKNMYYSINVINDIINSYNLNLLEKLNLKKIYILEAEIAKTNNISSLKSILKIDEVNFIINDTLSLAVPLKYKIFLYFLRNKNTVMLYTYNKIRRILKKIIGGRK